jgi:single-strand DNA-binding protein
MIRINRIELSGRTTADVELKQTTGGTPVAKFTLAVDKSTKNADGTWDNQAIFVDCVAWKDTAERIKDVSKGTPLYVEGRLDTRTYEKDGTRHKVTEVIVDRVQVEKTQANREVTTQVTTQDNTEDVPF